MSVLTDPASLPSPARLAMGLRPLGQGTLIMPDLAYAEERALKADLWAQHGRDVFDALPGYEEAQHEVCTILCRELETHHGLSVARTDNPPLLSIGLAVQEDLLLLAPHEQTYRLIAGALFFPALWRLQDKLGLSLAGIHGPVPHYGEQLALPMDRLFANLRADQPMERFNWTIHDTPELYRPGAHGGAVSELPEDAPVGELLWLRGERQTLSRLPQTGLVLFTIKTWRVPLGEAVGETPDWRDFLIKVLDAMPPEMKAYKSLPGREKALRRWLTEI